MFSCKLKGIEIWGPGCHNRTYIGTFDLLMLKVILGPFGPFVSKCPVSRKRLDIEHNGVNFGTLGYCRMHKGCSLPGSVEGHLGVIWCTFFKMACNSKRLFVE